MGVEQYRGIGNQRVGTEYAALGSDGYWVESAESMEGVNNDLMQEMWSLTPCRMFCRPDYIDSTLQCAETSYPSLGTRPRLFLPLSRHPTLELGITSQRQTNQTKPD